MTLINKIVSDFQPSFSMNELIAQREYFSQILDLYRASRWASSDVMQPLSGSPDYTLESWQYMDAAKRIMQKAVTHIYDADRQQYDCLHRRIEEYLNNAKNLFPEPASATERLAYFNETQMQAVVDHLDLMATLRSWVQEGTPGELRQLCSDTIITFLSTDSTALNLDSLNLTTLPPIFTSGSSFVKRVKELSLNFNNLGSFPVEVLELQELTSLLLAGNGLREVSADIFKLQKLERLVICNNELTSLPSELCVLSKLKDLYLHSNPLERLPPQFWQLQALEILGLQNTDLTILPSQISQLSSLKELQLDNVPLTGLPQQICLLPQSCVVDFGERCYLPEGLLLYLREEMGSPDYSGPYFTIGSEGTPLAEKEKSAQQLLQELYANAGKTPQEFPTLLQKGGKPLRLWLFRLNEMADFRNKDLQKSFVNLILEYLAFAEHDTRFLQEFLQVIEKAAETCGDRMALSVLYLGIQYRLATLDRRETKELADFLIQTVWAVNQLEIIAGQKVSQLRETQESDEEGIDEVQIYLTYPIKLKGQLKLEIDIEEMRYGSEVTQEDLANAVEFIQNQRNNEEARYEFLIEQKSWLEALALHSPEEMKKITDERESRLENAGDAVLIHKEYQQQLIALSKRVLSRKRPRSGF